MVVPAVEVLGVLAVLLAYLLWFSRSLSVFSLSFVMVRERVPESHLAGSVYHLRRRRLWYAAKRLRRFGARCALPRWRWALRTRFGWMRACSERTSHLRRVCITTIQGPRYLFPLSLRDPPPPLPPPLVFRLPPQAFPQEPSKLPDVALPPFLWRSPSELTLNQLFALWLPFSTHAAIGLVDTGAITRSPVPSDTTALLQPRPACINQAPARNTALIEVGESIGLHLFPSPPLRPCRNRTAATVTSPIPAAAASG